MSTVTLPTNFLEKKRPRVIRESEVVLKSLFNLTSAKLDQGCSNMSLHFFTSYNTTRSIMLPDSQVGRLPNPVHCLIWVR
jgi:hypothetical protein